MMKEEQTLLHTIFSRKSVRHFTSELLSKDQLELLMKAGMAAPSANNRQPWAFIGITERSLLDFLAEGLPYAKMLAQAGGAIVVCGDLSKIDPNKKEYWIQDCSAATQNILLAAEATGLGAVWTALYPYKERYGLVQEALSLPESVIPLCIIPLGYPTGEDLPKDKFIPGNIHWNKW
jgi:nitroreductase